MRRHPLIKDVISPIDGLFSKMPDDIWSDIIDSTDLDIELYTKLGELTSSPLVRFYDEQGDIEGLSAHLYRKHSRSWEQFKKALHEEYNMFLTSRLNETITNTTEEEITGEENQIKQVDSNTDDSSESSNIHKIKGKIKTSGDNTETHDRKDKNVTLNTEDGVSELTVDRMSEIDRSDVRDSEVESEIDTTLNKETESEDVLTLDKEQVNDSEVNLESTTGESGDIKKTGENEDVVTEEIDETDVIDVTGNETNSGEDEMKVEYDSEVSVLDTLTKSGSESNNETMKRTPNLTTEDTNTTNYGKSTTNTGQQKNTNKEDVFGFGSSEPTSLNKSENIRLDEDLKETLGGIDTVTNVSEVTGEDKTTTDNTLTFDGRKDSHNVTTENTGDDTTTTKFGLKVDSTEDTTTTRDGFNETTTNYEIDETETRDLTTSVTSDEDSISTVTDTGTEIHEVEGSETTSSNEVTNSSETTTDEGSEEIVDTGTETTTNLNEVVGEGELTQTGTVNIEDSNVTEYEGYEEVNESDSSNVRTDNVTEGISGDNRQQRTTTQTQDTSREADSPLSTTQSLVHEEIEMRMKYNLVDLILESIRKDITLSVWRY